MNGKYWIGLFKDGTVSPIIGLPWLWLTVIVLAWYNVFKGEGSRHYRRGYYDILDRRGI